MSSPEMMARRVERERQARKAAEKLLEEKSREIYEINQNLSKVALFADLSPHAVLRFDVSGHLLLANDAARKLIGVDVEPGTHLAKMLPQFMDLDIQSIVAGDEIYQVAIQIGQGYHQFVFRGVSDHGFINVYSTDITQQELVKKQIENAHRETEQLLSSISSVLIGVDKDLKVVRWNEMAEATFGLNGAEVIGQSFEACPIKWCLEDLQKYIDESKYEDYALIPEVHFTNAAGGDGFMAVVVNVVVDSKDNFNGYLVLASDITERKVLEGQLIQAQKLESLGQLAAGIAHEINTPIQFIGDNTRFLEVAFKRLHHVIDKGQALLAEVKGGTGILQQVMTDMEEAIKKAKLAYMAAEIPFAIEETLGGVEQVASIVSSMKQFSHPGSKSKTHSNINEAIISTINVARNEWKYVAALETELAEDLPNVPCLQSELNQVVLNMIVNAAHAIEEKNKGTNEKGIIKIKTQLNGAFAEIHISDSGAGIPEHVVAKIFDPFFTTKEVGKGSGQGLSVAHNVIYDKHGGTIEVETVPGEGTMFNIRLPMELAIEEV